MEFLAWLWVMVNTSVAFFSVKASRSKEAFEELIGHWAGILVSDGYGVYRKWVEERQTCLAHLIRRAEGLAERKDPVVARFGERVCSELRRLIDWANAPPTQGEVSTWYARMCHLIDRHRGRKDEGGSLQDIWTARWHISGSFSLRTTLSPPIIAPREPFALQYSGAE